MHKIFLIILYIDLPIPVASFLSGFFNPTANQTQIKKLECSHLIALCCTLCSMLNSFFSLSGYRTEDVVFLNLHCSLGNTSLRLDTTTINRVWLIHSHTHWISHCIATTALYKVHDTFYFLSVYNIPKWLFCLSFPSLHLTYTGLPIKIKLCNRYEQMTCSFLGKYGVQPSTCRSQRVELNIYDVFWRHFAMF